MLRKRLWIALMICVCLITVGVMGAERSRQATAAGVIDPSCTSSLPCIEYDNNGTGPGIRGISVKGNGVSGGTKFNSTSTANGKAGIFGNDQSTSGSFNSGVKGMSTNGNGVLGQSTNNSGIEGVSTNADGVRALSTNGAAVSAFSNNSYGVSASTGNASGGVAGVRGVDESTGSLDSGVAGFSTNGIGVSGLSTNFVGVNAVGGKFVSSFVINPALSIVANPGFNALIAGCPGATVNPCDVFHSVFEVDTNGDVLNSGNVNTGSFQDRGTASIDGDTQIFGGLDVGTVASPAPSGSINITGQYQKNGSCKAGCFVATIASAGRAVVTYAPTVSQPTIEDFGEAQLVNGQASVQLDPKFANVIEHRVNYLVFITPEGDANTLYVTEKTIGGFTVRESHGGRSTLMFSYRIVAKPFGSREARLPMVELPKLRSSLPIQARRFHPKP